MLAMLAMLTMHEGGNRTGRGLRQCWQCRTGFAVNAKRTRGTGEGPRSVVGNATLLEAQLAFGCAADPQRANIGFRGFSHVTLARRQGAGEGALPGCRVDATPHHLNGRQSRRDRSTLASAAATCSSPFPIQCDACCWEGSRARLVLACIPPGLDLPSLPTSEQDVKP